MTLTMHSHGAIVEANDAGDSIALGNQYADLANYRAIPTFAIGNFFDYTTTGAFEDWANDKLGLPVLEVELESATADVSKKCGELECANIDCRDLDQRQRWVVLEDSFATDLPGCRVAAD